MRRKNGTYRALIDHAIGALADLGTDLIMYRKDLYRIREKEEWDEANTNRLYRSLSDMAFKCGMTLEDWEKETGIYIPRPQGGSHGR